MGTKTLEQHLTFSTAQAKKRLDNSLFPSHLCLRTERCVTALPITQIQAHIDCVGRRALMQIPSHSSTGPEPYILANNGHVLNYFDATLVAQDQGGRLERAGYSVTVSRWIPGVNELGKAHFHLVPFSTEEVRVMFADPQNPNRVKSQVVGTKHLMEMIHSIESQAP